MTPQSSRLIEDCAQPARWTGVRTSFRVRHWQGVEFDYAHEPLIQLVDAPRDLSSHPAFRFFVGQSLPSQRVLQLVVESANARTVGLDGWVGALPLDFKGLRRAVLFRDEMERVGEPLGWDQITGLRFTTRGEGDGVAGIAMIELVDLEKSGPVLQDQAFFRAINLEFEGLEAVRAAVQSGDLCSARAAYASFLRSKHSQQPPDPDAARGPQDLDLLEPEQVARGAIKLLGVRHQFKDGRIDWSFNPTHRTPDRPYNVEWEVHLNRMTIWPLLARAYRQTGDERFARAWVSQLRSWISDCPYDPESRKSHQSRHWEMLVTGCRMKDSWPVALHAFIRSPALRDDDLINFAKLVVEHARHLRGHHTKRFNNHILIELHGLHTAACLFPELREADQWRDYVIRRLGKAIRKIFGPDGFSRELSPSYQILSIKQLLGVVRTARRFQFAGAGVEQIEERLTRAFVATMHLMAPDRRVPGFNDCGRSDVPAFLDQWAGSCFPDRPDLLWVATDGARGAPPDRSSCFLPWAGYCAMRSDWGRGAQALFFDIGPLGLNHAHQDKLSVVLWSHGRMILYDGGGGSYEDSEWRRYAIDTHSHNTVLVDGAAQRRRHGVRSHERSVDPIDARWESCPTHDFASGTYDGPYGASPPPWREVVETHPATHTRRVLFLKPDLYLVVDNLDPHDDAEHIYQARWHLLSTRTTSGSGSGVVTTADSGQPNLVVLPLFHEGLEIRAVSGQTRPEILGWRVLIRGRRVKTTSVLHTRRGPGPARFLTLLLPLGKGTVDPVVSVERTGPDSARVVFDDRRSLQVEVSRAAGGAIKVCETLADGSPGRSVLAGAARNSRGSIWSRLLRRWARSQVRSGRKLF